MSGLGIRLLGPPQLELAGQTMKLQRQKAVGLLVYLAVERSNHSRDALAALLWPESSKKNARAAVRRTLSYLNKQLGKGWLRLEGGLVSLNWEEDILLDVAHFQDLLTAAEIQDKNNGPFSEEAIGLLTEAAEIYNNDFLAGFTLPDAPAFDEWQYFQAESLRQQQGQVLAQLVQYHTGMQHLEQAIGYARQRLTLDPLQEAAHRQLMAFYSWSGQRHAALRQYQVCVDLLAEELQVEPEEPTKAIYELVRTDKLPPLSTSMPADFSQMVALSALQDVEVDRHLERESYEIGSEEHTLKPTETHFNNLPVSVTTFVGREDEIRQVSDLLKNKPDCRLMTLFGPGGIGKTRLAIEAARQIQNEFKHGIGYVSLSPVAVPEDIVITIGESLKFDFSGSHSPLEQLLDYFREKEILLVLDNFEHLLAGAPMLTKIIQEALGVKIIVTSREQLSLHIEWLVEVQGLSYAQKDKGTSFKAFSSNELFILAARKRQPDFKPNQQEEAGIMHLCRWVQGMPLAIELMASWVDVLPITEIVDEMSKSLDLLTKNLQDIPERHQSIRSAFSNSWNRLTSSQRYIFCQLSLFRGGFSRVAAKVVTGASYKDLSELVRKSLIKFHQRDSRYYIHELLRQYGAEKLEMNPKLKQTALNKFMLHYSEHLHRLELELKSEKQIAALHWITKEIENISLAWVEAINHGRANILNQCISSMGYFYEWRSNYMQGMRAFLLAIEGLENADENTMILARLNIWLSNFQRYLGDLVSANKHINLANNLLDKGKYQEPEQLSVFGFLYLHQGFLYLNHDRNAAYDLFKDSYSMYEQINDEWGMANALGAAGGIAFLLGNYKEARHIREDSLSLWKQLGAPRGLANQLSSLSFTDFHGGRIERSEALGRESVAIYRAIGDRAILAHGLKKFAVILYGVGKPAESEKCSIESMVIDRDLGNRRALAHTYTNLSVAQLMLGKLEEASLYIDKGLDLAHEMKVKPALTWAMWNKGLIELCNENYLEAWEISQKNLDLYQKLGQVGEQGFAIVNLGLAARGLGKREVSKKFFLEALSLGLKLRFLYPLYMGLFGIALILCDEEFELNLEENTRRRMMVVELYIQVMKIPYVHNNWMFNNWSKPLLTLKGSFSPEQIQFIQDKVNSQNIWKMSENLLNEITESDWIANGGSSDSTRRTEKLDKD